MYMEHRTFHLFVHFVHTILSMEFEKYPIQSLLTFCYELLQYPIHLQLPLGTHLKLIGSVSKIKYLFYFITIANKFSWHTSRNIARKFTPLERFTINEA
jgi:hypothetical protein